MSESEEFSGAKKKPKRVVARLSMSIDKEVFQKFTDWCEDNGYDRSRMVELIIKKFMEVKESE